MKCFVVFVGKCISGGISYSCMYMRESVCAAEVLSPSAYTHVRLACYKSLFTVTSE